MSGWNDGWLVPIIFVGLCTMSFLWTWATAPGFNARDKHVLISGGTKGIGLAIAKKYVQAGAKLSLVGRSMARLEHARAEIQQSGELSSSHPVFLAACDISDIEQVETAIAQANAFHERVTDHVVHAAIITTPGLAWVQDLAQMRKDTGTTYFGAVNLFRSATPAMVESDVRGNFVIVSLAVDVFTSSVGSSAFSGPLIGLRGLAESLRNELLPMGIAVSMYYPGKVSSGSSTRHVTAPSTVAKEPQTPTAGSDEINYDFAAMKDALSPSPLDLDVAAQNLFDGLRAGYFLITNSWSGFCYRVASAGITPRKVLVFEFTLAFFMIPYFEISRLLRERHAKRTAPSSVSRFTQETAF